MFPSLVLVVATSSTTPVEKWLDDIVDGRGALPSLVSVQRAAVDALGSVANGDVQSWARRARFRGLVPRLDVRFGTDVGLDLRDSAASTSDRTWREDRAIGFDLGARFELGELVFSEAELRANREHLACTSAARLARDDVTKLYFRLVELQLAQRQSAASELYVEAARVRGLLDAATGGRIEWR